MLRHSISPSPTPTPSPSPSTPQFHASSTASVTTAPPPPSKLPLNFSPPLIAMVVTIATAFVIITYSRLLSRHLLHNYRRYRRWRHRRRRSPPSPSIQSPPYPFDQSFHVLSPYGLDDSVIKTIPLSIHHRKSGYHDCAVCLLEFEEHDYVRTLPICSHAFHVDCIDVWLRSHANCPLCRAGIFRPDSPLFTPLMAARIRPSLDDIIIENALTEIETEIETEVEPLTALVTEIEQIQLEDGFCNRRDFLLKRSYSFGYERNLGSERLTLTASPWRYRRSAASAAAIGGGGGSFWSKRPSPFSSLSKPRVFSFRYYRGMKSPNFFRRRSTSGFFPLSESARRSRLRSGDPEALLSPERYNRR